MARTGWPITSPIACRASWSPLLPGKTITPKFIRPMTSLPEQQARSGVAVAMWLPGKSWRQLDVLDLPAVVIQVPAQELQALAGVERAGQEVREDDLGEIQAIEGCAE